MQEEYRENIYDKAIDMVLGEDYAKARQDVITKEYADICSQLPSDLRNRINKVFKDQWALDEYVFRTAHDLTSSHDEASVVMSINNVNVKKAGGSI